MVYAAQNHGRLARREPTLRQRTSTRRINEHGKLGNPFEHWPPIEPTTELVKLSDGETPETVFQSWLSKASASARFCAKHRRTKLELNRKESSFEPVYQNDDRWRESRLREVKPGQFTFKAVFDCPAVRCEAANCPPEFVDTCFDAFDTSSPESARSLAKAREFVTQVNAHDCGFALFVGPTGVGKTRLACNIIKNLRGCRARFVRQGELTFALRSTYGHKTVTLRRSDYEIEDEDGFDDKQMEPPKPLKTVQEVPFLVLDEIGCNPLADDERLYLDELVKYRYENRKPTILISNLPLSGPPERPGLKGFLGDALTDRIKDATGNGKFIVQFTGDSYRRTTGENYLDGLR